MSDTNDSGNGARRRRNFRRFARLLHEMFTSGVWAQLSDAERAVLPALSSYADDYGMCWPSVPKLAKRAGKGERSTQTALKKLRERGLVIVLGHKPGWRSRLYQVVGLAPLNEGPDEGEGGGGAASPVAPPPAPKGAPQGCSLTSSEGAVDCTQTRTKKIEPIIISTTTSAGAGNANAPPVTADAAGLADKGFKKKKNANPKAPLSAAEQQAAIHEEERLRLREAIRALPPEEFERRRREVMEDKTFAWVHREFMRADPLACEEVYDIMLARAIMDR